MFSLWKAHWPLGLACCLAPGSLGFSQSVSDYCVRLSATVQTNPPRVTLTWPGDSRATGYTLYRKSRDGAAWGAGTVLATNATSFVDSNVAVGQTYEYRVSKTASGYSGHGYLYAGLEAPLVEDRGKLVLLVDNTHAASLALELSRLQQDLVGDGWTVLRHDVARTDAVTNVKALIAADYAADPANVKALFLFGHLPVPYSGSIAPDGHSDHVGAWPADAYYGDMDGPWTDATLTSTNASRAENRNVPGDGKFDQSSLPSAVELFVGRVDLANLPAFASSERELLRQYLEKDHNFRHKFTTAQARGLIDDNFGVFSGEAFALNGWRNFAPCFGAANSVAADWFTTLATQSYLWGYGCGAGGYTSASGIGTTADFAASDPRVVFTMLFGSYFGDWDSQNNFMRAALATPTCTLTCAWAGRPHWAFHHMALGEPIGFSARLAQNNSGLYAANGYSRSVHIALLGDPTLRMHVVAPPAALTLGARAEGGADLGWRPSSEGVLGYLVYGAASADGPFTRLTPGPVAGTNFSDLGAAAAVYMVRAVKLESAASGTYFNASQGVFQSLDGSLGTPAVSLWQPADKAVFNAPATIRMAAGTRDFANAISKVEFRADGVRLGEDTTPPFGLSWSNAPVGAYSLTAIATTFDSQAVTSGPVQVRVDAPLVAAGAVWKYLDDGSNQGTAWRGFNFDDGEWASGPAELGYGNNPVTVVGFGPNETNKHITTYFRRTFTVDAPGLYTNLTLGLLRDDGAVVYLNGLEVVRSNMPGGTITYLTRALSAVGGADESTFFPTTLNAALLRAGTNLLAVEIHQSAPDSSDLGFNLYLSASGRQLPPALSVSRGPGGVFLRWPDTAFGYRLEATPMLPPVIWTNVPATVVAANGTNTVTVIASDACRFFRLTKP
jgi:hypothetical protein